MRLSGRGRHSRRGIGTVLATIVFVFIVIFMTANLIVWGVVQSADFQSVVNQMTQRDEQQASERISLPGALFGGTTKSVSCEVGTGSTCVNPSNSCYPAACAGEATTPIIANENFTSNTNGWIFNKILAPGTSAGITGGYDAGGTENGAVGSPSGPGLVYMGVSYFPPVGTATYSASWSNRFLVDLNNFGLSSLIPGSSSLNNQPPCNGPNCSVTGSWAWTLPRVNPGVIAMTVKFEVADSSATGTSCSAPHCYVLDEQTYTTLADQTWNFRKTTWGGFSTSGTATAGSGTSLTDSQASWSTDQWKYYQVSVTTPTRTETGLICTNNATTLTITAGNSTTCSSPVSFSPNPVANSDAYKVELTIGGTATGTQTSTTLQDTTQTWYVNEWANDYVSIVSGTGTIETGIIQSNTANTLTLTNAWTTTPDSTSQYVIGCPSDNFCNWDIYSNTLIHELPTTYTPGFWGTSSSPGYYSVQVETDFTLSQSSNPSEVRVLVDDLGLEFSTPTNFASPSGSAASGTIIDMPLSGIANTGLIQQLDVSTATAFNKPNIQEAAYIKDYTTGSFIPLSSGFVSQQTVNNTNIFTGADVQRYLGTLPAANLLNRPESAAFDSTGNLWVADTGNNRVVEFLKSGFASGESATVVIGQSSLTASNSATSASGLSAPGGIAFDGSGNLWVSDTGNNRILEFKTPFSNGESASLVIGQATFTASGSATSQIGLVSPSGIAFDTSGNLWVADTGNNRVLEFQLSATGTASGGSSTTLVDSSKAWTTNQWTGFTVTITGGTGSGSTGTVSSNTGTTLTVSSWSSTAPAMSSTYSIASPPNNADAATVIGQSSFTVSSPSPDSGTATGTQCTGTCNTFVDTSKTWSTNQWVNGVVSIVSGTGSGQSRSITSNTATTLTVSPNWTKDPVAGSSTYSISPSSTTVANTEGPTRLKFDNSRNLWVSDTGNNRILSFPTPFSNGEDATIVIGQGKSGQSCSFTTSSSATAANGLSGPEGIQFDTLHNLWVADAGNNRVLEFPIGGGWGTSSCGENAGTVLGQSLLTTNTGGTTISTLESPANVVFDSPGGNAWVTDRTNSRVLEFLSTLSTGESANIVLGQTSFTVSSHPNVEVKITATSPVSFTATTMQASVEAFFKDPNHVTIQVANGWASTSYVADIFIIDSSGTHCFTRVPMACGSQYVSSSTGSVTGNTLTDSKSWTSNQWQNFFAYITSGTGVGSYGTISSNTATALTVGSWTGTTAPSGTVSYFVGQTWPGIYVAPGTTAVVSLQYTWNAGPVIVKVTTDLGNTVVLDTVAS